MTGERALAVGELVSFSVAFLMNEGKNVKLGEPQFVTISVHHCSGLRRPPCSILTPSITADLGRKQVPSQFCQIIVTMFVNLFTAPGTMPDVT